MPIPDPVNAVNGMSQGPDGFSQGAIGAQVGQHLGPGIGIDRAATGGPNMEQPTQPTVNTPTPGATAQNATRKPQGLFSFLGSIASAVAPVIPGAGIVGGLLTGIGGMQAQNQANAAANAATQNETALAQELATGQDLQPLISEEQAGISSAVRNSNAANPGRLIMDAFGNAISNAIKGVSAGTSANQSQAAGIYENVAGSATRAAQTQPNPWSSLGTALAGFGTGTTGGSSASPSSVTTIPAGDATSTGQLGTFDIQGGIKPLSSQPATGAGSVQAAPSQSARLGF